MKIFVTPSVVPAITTMCGLNLMRLSTLPFKYRVAQWKMFRNRPPQLEWEQMIMIMTLSLRDLHAGLQESVTLPSGMEILF